MLLIQTKQHLSRLYLSAAHKSSGKTTLSIGICRAIKQRGFIVQPYKKGPDYIDPLWLTAASQSACYNLDFNTMTEVEILRYLARYSLSSNPHKISLIEGNKGLYDGMDIHGADSNAALAKLLQAPVVLIINVQGTTRGIAPLLQGYQQFDPDINIAGVIFNKVGAGGHAKRLLEVAEHYTNIPVLGVVPKHRDLMIEERHLGLMPSNEEADSDLFIERIARVVNESVDIDRLVEISDSASPLPLETLSLTQSSNVELLTASSSTKPDVLVIGICKDKAFGFYYPDDLMALEKAGAKLVFIDTLHDKALPNIDGLFIGGGFPETQMKELSRNQSMRDSIKEAIDNGLPVYAECGGLMYLSENLIWNNECYPMVGVIPADTNVYRKPQGRGLIKATVQKEMLWNSLPVGKTINAHEFHYSKLNVKDDRLINKGQFAYSMERGQGINAYNDGWMYNNLLASYIHIRDTDQFRWSKAFIDFVRKIKNETQF